MKQVYRFLLAFVLMLSLPRAAFATDSELKDSGATQDISVSAKCESGTTAPLKYSVDIGWGAMEFTYSLRETKEWDPQNHTYVTTTTGAWSANGNQISVTNHSNTAVTAGFVYESDDSYATVNGQFDKAAVTLPSAVGMALDAAELTDTATLTLDGTLERDVTAMTKVGTITVSIS